MSRRGRKRALKLRIKKSTVHSVLSIVLLVSAGVILISFFAPNYILNEKVQKYVRLAFGSSAVLLPFVLAVGGLLFVHAIKWKFIELRVLFGMTGLLLGMAGLFHIFNPLDEAAERAWGGMGGGLVGFQISSILISLISKWGGVLVLFAVIVISLIFIFDVSFDELVGRVRNLLEKIKGLSKEGRGGKEAKKEDEIKIKTGADVLDNADEDEEEIEDTRFIQEELPEPAFEVVPSMSEPQIAGKGTAIGLGGKRSDTIVPGLPYTDRVWEYPPLDILAEPAHTPVDRGDVKARAKIIEDTLKSFGVNVKVIEVNFGPSVTQYALEAQTGTKIANVSNLQYDLALALASPTGSVRVEAPIPGRSLIGIEVPNNSRVTVHFKEIFTSDQMKGMKSKLSIVLGKNVGGQPMVYDISRTPHLLVAGSTGSGKSMFLHSILFSLLYRCSPMECKFILVDLKRVELVHYRDIPHLLTPVVTEIDRAAAVFRWAVAEMERRYKLLEAAKVRDIDGYNEKSGFQALSYIVVMVDELAEIMVADPASVEKSIIRLAQLARATGIHLILTVQRPSTNVITGLIKANIPCRVAFNVTSQIDSRVIIDQPGAEKLLGMGDMLFVPPDISKPIRIQGTLVSEKEVNSLVAYLKSTGVDPEYREEVFDTPVPGRSISAGGRTRDSFFDEAVDVVVSAGKASASLLQRRLSIGYARAARILDELEEDGVIGPAKGSKPRSVLIKDSGADGSALSDGADSSS